MSQARYLRRKTGRMGSKDNSCSRKVVAVCVLNNDVEADGDV